MAVGNTWGALVTQTQRLLDDTAADRWTTAVIYGYLNDTQTEFQTLTEVVKATSGATSPTPAEHAWLTVTIQTGITHYDVSGTTPLIGRILRMEDAQGNKIREVTEDILDLTYPNWGSAPESRPTHFIPRQAFVNNGGTTSPSWFSLWPAPDRSHNNQVYRLLCAVLPANIATDGTESAYYPRIPFQFHQCLPYGAAYRCLQWNQDSLSISLADKYKARFDEFVAMARGV